MLHVELLESEPYVLLVGVRAQVERRDHTLHGLRALMIRCSDDLSSYEGVTPVLA
jgi:hypothetical protein